MSRWTNHLYSRSPAWCQDLTLSAKSAIQNRQRRTGMYGRYFQQFLRNQWLDADAVRQLQLDRFCDVFGQAYQRVPYYREVFDQAGWHPSEFRNFDQLRDLPLLTKQQLREDPTQFVDDRRSAVYVGMTGGTTGTPLASPADRETMQYTMALMDRFMWQSGVDWRERNAICGAKAIVPADERQRFWRRDYWGNSLFFSMRHMSEKSLATYVDALAEFRPLWIKGIASFVHEIARWIVEHGQVGRIRLAAVFPSSETTTDHMRSEMETAYGSKVFDHYGSTEAVPLITQCRVGRYHIVPESGYIEFLRPDGSQADPGEPAEMVMTSLRQLMRPLLRYQIMDTGSYSLERCPCGLPWTVVEKLHGRLAEWIVTRDGRRISLMGDLIFKAGAEFGFHEIQVIQTTPDHFDVLLVKGPDYNLSAEAALIRRFEENMFHRVYMNFQYVENIPKSAGGKRRIIISRVAEQTGICGHVDSQEVA